ncbi:zinc finger domain-containing protein [Streptomyces sp. URMC 129]|uniref:zinc finger domain-containing protein n=1 Tax=Streptomyces sp. URMC 129 TaxID=3423407 RepID=UPI003F1A3D33
MNRVETAALLAAIGSVDSRVRRQLGDPQAAHALIDTWHEALADIPATTPGGWDIGRAARSYYEQAGDNSARYWAIDPHHVMARWADYRHAAIADHTDPVPPVDPDHEAAWRRALAARRAAVMTGQAPPARARELGAGGPAPALADTLSGVGRRIPPEAAALLAAAGVGRRRHERPEIAAVPCRYDRCRARRGQPCRAPSGRLLRDVHATRKDDYAATLTAPAPQHTGATP